MICPKYNQSTLVIIIIAVFVLLGLGIAGFFVFSKSESAPDSNVPEKENIATSKLPASLNVSNSKLTYNEMNSWAWYGEKEIAENQEVEFGRDIYIYISGVSGFKEVNGKVFPGSSLTYISTSGEEITASEDGLKEYTESGISPKDAKSFTIEATIGNPLKHGESYKIKAVVWDKKGAGKIEAELNIKVK